MLLHHCKGCFEHFVCSLSMCGCIFCHYIALVDPEVGLCMVPLPRKNVANYSQKRFSFVRDLRSFEIRFEFESAVPIRFESDGPIQNFRIGRACPLLVVVKRLKPLTALSGTVYELASFMSDHTPVLFNMFEEWNEKFVVLHVSFVSFVINYWLLNARFYSYSVGLYTL